MENPNEVEVKYPGIMKISESCQVRFRDKMITLQTMAGQSIHLDGELKF